MTLYQTFTKHLLRFFFYTGNNILCKRIASVLLYSVCKVTGTLFHMDVVMNMVLGGGGGMS